ncbi:DUF262 domain-containing protein [Anoxybacillus flavithermus]|uniref:DUF262 domain-containing protein n=1 Tax=Anoxybacillus flavithermus TaxID=33934 RepID=A0AAX1ZZN4_9BACL|nr:DUF262 domain-containing protein [Anoxybacillus flavithermus]MBE2906715.1 DUF262 domain-containing protein [Anoxybacillus flavithermus]MBE2910046.1 DUF262 domain-containing protein [Anoxybacillus flavithermus]MBE2919984.1 DUF262 domain-containing protein [Anoxybacillus flavithermus]MBE2935919.1 DUF262 domain-containing protein [Anoxybacillus flavithermus]RWU09239.1 DUF262 domain-containing protein [Anoxybacillus flavithermus]
MKANETKLQPIIEGTKQYVLPLFQRSYSWDKKEWEVLWDDLVDLCETENPRDHFIGSIVSMPTSSVPEGVSKFLLIDGQQRLTTIFIILTLLRDLAKLSGNIELADEINNTLIVNPYKKDSDYFKLLPTQVDRSAYKKMVLSEIEQNDDSQIYKAYQYFERKIKQSHIDISRLKSVISNRLSIVSIVLDPDDNPYLVFESLNAKGRPLTQADLIRNFFFMRIHVQDQEVIYNKYWRPMQYSLGENLTEFIRHYLMKDGLYVKQNEIYFFVKEIASENDILEYIKNMYVFSTHYEKLLSPDKESNREIQMALNRLNRMEATTVYPFLLNCYDDYYRGQISDTQFVEVISIIENFLVRRFVCNVPTNQLNKIFNSLYKNTKDDIFDNFIKLLKNHLQSKNYPKDNEFFNRLIDAKLYGSGERGRKTKLILESIEEFFEHKEQVDFDNLTIEHIMPQTLTQSWQEYLGEEWQLVHDLYLHTLGNLTLTGYNSELSNDDFDIKKEKLKASHLEINKYFEKVTSWKKEDIEQRAKHLAEICLKIWPYFGNERTDAGVRVTGTNPKELYILGQQFEVHSWRDVLENTMNTIADLEPEKFEQLMVQFPRLVGRDPKKFRAIRQLKNEAYIEVNLSAQSIQRFCVQAIEAVELTTDDWKVITE